MKRTLGVAAGLLLLLIAATIGWRVRVGRQRASAVAATTSAPSARERLALPAPLPRLRLSDAQVAPHGATSGELAGRVLSTTSGAGVANATLTFLHQGAAYTVGTDEHGAFDFRVPEPGSYQLGQAAANGYQPFEPELGQSAIRLEAQAGVRIDGVTLYLAPLVEYTVRVVDGSGKPVSGASVQVIEPPSPARLDTDENGEATLSANDDAIVEASHPSRGRGRAVIDLAAQASHRVIVKLSPLASTKPASIAGRVLDGRSPADGALVEAVCRDGAVHASVRATAAADGRFELPLVDDCPHELTAKLDGRAPARASAVKPGTRDVELVLSAGGTLRGRVRDAAARPVAAFTVLVAERKGAIERGEARTQSFFSADGRFEMTGLPPGSYAVSAAANGRAPSSERTVEVTASGVAEVELSLSTGGKVSGTVVDRQSGAALAGARVAVEGAVDPDSLFGPVSSSAVTDGNGRFSLGGLTPGLHSITVVADGHNPRILSGLQLQADGELGPLTVDLAPTPPGQQPQMEFVGIGAVLRAEGDAMLIVNAMPGGGAAAAGLGAGDAILAIDGVPAVELGFAGSIERIRGPEGTTVSLLVRRKLDGASGVVAVVRRALGGSR